MTTRFWLIVEQALEVERELRALENGGVRISGHGLLAASLGQANATVEDADALLERIEGDPEAYRACRSYIVHTHRLIADGRINAPLPLARQGCLGLEDAKVELPAGATPRLLWCAAVRAVMLRDPGLFGDIDDMLAHMARCAELRARRDELSAALEGAWSSADVEVHPVTTSERDAGLCRLIIRGTGVPIGDRLGERLINTLLARERTAEAA